MWFGVFLVGAVLVSGAGGGPLNKCCPRGYLKSKEGCQLGSGTNTTELSLKNVGMPGCRGILLETDSLVLEEGGEVLRLLVPGLGELLPSPLDYCLDTDPQGRLVATLCLRSSDCLQSPCIFKCCPHYEYFLGGVCVPGYNGSLDLTPVYNYSRPPLGVHPGCRDRIALQPYLTPEDDFLIFPNGTLYMTFHETELESYCVEDVVEEGLESGVHVFVCSADGEEYDPQRPGDLLELWRPLLAAISCLFLLATLLVYSCLPTFRNLHGRTLRAYAATLLLGYALFALNYCLTEFYNVPLLLCQLLGYSMGGFFLASFCWLNVVCFDIWWTFGANKAPIGRKARSRKRFIYYSIYAWYTPIFLTICTVLSDYFEFIPEYARAGVGLESCWMHYEMNGRWIYFYGPITLLLLSNLVFFILTIRAYSRVKDNLNHFRNMSGKKNFHSDTNKMAMSIKLFLVMGVSWVSDILAAMAGREGNTLTLLADIKNSLVGVVIFFIFVWKKKVLRAIREKLGSGRKQSITITQNTTLTSVSSATGNRALARTKSESISLETYRLRSSVS